MAQLTQNSICCLRSVDTLQNGDVMDNFTNLLAMFLDLDHVRILAVYGRVRELSGYVKNILICVPEMTGGLTGLEQHEGE